jgi:hypothetical protein
MDMSRCRVELSSLRQPREAPNSAWRQVSQQSADVPEMAEEQAPEITPKHEHSYGLGISIYAVMLVP